MSPAGPSYTYRVVTPPVRTRRPITTSRTEVLHLAIACAVLTVDLAIIISQSTLLFGSAGLGYFQQLSLQILVTAAAAALSAFVAHELAHKIVAQRRGFWAEFRMSPYGLMMSLITALIGFLWAAPGATVVSGMSPADRVGWGHTSIAGPLTNLAFAGVFYGVAIGVPLHQVGLVQELLLLAYFNSWFATFNLVPLGPLDGRKVFRWNVPVWAGAFVLSAAAAVLSYLAFAFTNPLFFR